MAKTTMEDRLKILTAAVEKKKKKLDLQKQIDTAKKQLKALK